MDLDHLKKLVDACHEEAERTNDTLVSGATLDAYLLTVEPAKSLATRSTELRETLRAEFATGADSQRLWAEVSAERDAYRAMLADLVAATTTETVTTTTAKADRARAVFDRAVTMLKNGPSDAADNSGKGAE